MTPYRSVPSAQPTPFIEGIDICPSLQCARPVNWHAVAGSGIKFVYIQATNGATSKQAAYDAAYVGAKEENLRVGAYHFFRADVSPIAQIEWFLGRAGTIAADDLPPMLDVEQTEGVAPSVVADSLVRAIEHLESLSKRRPILYTYPSFWTRQMGSFGLAKFFAAYRLWIAHYGVATPTIPAPWTEYAIHQYVGNGGRVPGIVADCDRDRTRWDLDALVEDSIIRPDTEPPTTWHPAEAVDILPTIFASTDDTPTIPGTPTSKSSQRLAAVDAPIIDPRGASTEPTR